MKKRLSVLLALTLLVMALVPAVGLAADLPQTPVINNIDIAVLC